MTILMEHVADSVGWPNQTQHSTDDFADTLQEGAIQKDVARAEMVPGGRALLVDCLPRASRATLLQRIVDAEILPRLALVRRNTGAVASDASPVTTHDDTTQLVQLLLTREAASAIAFLDVLRLRGVPLAAVYLGPISLAARILGELWDQDRCDFTQVTISMGRLQQVLRALSPRFQIEAVRRPQAESVLLVPAPGEQHTFGLVMLAEFFTRDGWHVAGGPATSNVTATNIVRSAWFDLVGFSIGSAGRLEGLARCIRSVRLASRNPDLFVMVGGPLFLAQPDLVTRVGADTAAPDGAAAVRQARGLLGMRAAAD